MVTPNRLLNKIIKKRRFYFHCNIDEDFCIMIDLSTSGIISYVTKHLINVVY